jgi:hypothetical protein
VNNLDKLKGMRAEYQRLSEQFVDRCQELGSTLEHSKWDFDIEIDIEGTMFVAQPKNKQESLVAYLLDRENNVVPVIGADSPHTEEIRTAVEEWLNTDQKPMKPYPPMYECKLKGNYLVSLSTDGEWHYTVEHPVSDIGKALFVRDYPNKEVVYHEENTFKGTNDELLEIQLALQNYILTSEKVTARVAFINN